MPDRAAKPLGRLIMAVWLAWAAPALAETPPATLLAAGDIAKCGVAGAAATSKLLDRLSGAVVALGDLAYPQGTAEQFRDCYGPTWGRHKARTWPAPGNHEYFSQDAVPYYAYWGSRAGEPGRGYYGFDLGAWHIIALNSNIGANEGSAQDRWLRRHLAAATARCILAFWHHPVFSSGRHGDNPKMAVMFRRLHEAGASIVPTGHDHNYERFAPLDADGRLDPQRGIRSFVVGTGGTTPRPIENTRKHSRRTGSFTWGLLKLVLFADRYTWEFVPVDGQILADTGSASCVRRR